MKTQIVIRAAADCGGVNSEEDGSVRFELKPGRSPKQYYGLAVARLNRVFDWGKPWRVTGHEINQGAL